MTSRRLNCVKLSSDRCDASHVFGDKGGTHRILIIVKVIRAGLRFIEETMRRNPDLTVIHLVRDPRATACSQYELLKDEENDDAHRTRGLKLSVTDFAVKLCSRILEDLRIKRRLEVTYPGAVMTVRYEDFVNEPHSTVKNMFEHVGHKIRPGRIEDWIMTHISNSNDNALPEELAIMKRDSKSHISKWRRKLNSDQLNYINTHCRQVLNKLNYTV